MFDLLLYFFDVICFVVMFVDLCLVGNVWFDLVVLDVVVDLMLVEVVVFYCVWVWVDY